MGSGEGGVLLAPALQCMGIKMEVGCSSEKA